ncbi:hypothetical protein COW57_00535 [Candidatus Roizmanbacteria bacterium CG17_big_fil_post_rev_8_21_14_2_50_39_7]|uniref:riboflavin kinase n=1 Tax=Candidatus Roizmanbacteria bacterium CG17_big_fil_post_rev_8_21_14_2_50_39_7 TaxID=1974858 RepID=A0A2M7EKZ3_9BACT|nr:MAG: hypothetical protein COW57_00535 [Candidatus Roizmanbacteria bacterium CG17_big_fil_post_rev_8_21_14_2_50_39_7]
MRFTGTHTMGRKRARTLGFPTINLHNINTVTIDDGVYAARATINNSQFKAAMFVGESPTFKDKEKTVELYLIGLNEEEIKKYPLDSLISTIISIETVCYIRPVIKFSSRNDLIRQIEVDVKEIGAILDA